MTHLLPQRLQWCREVSSPNVCLQPSASQRFDADHSAVGTLIWDRSACAKTTESSEMGVSNKGVGAHQGESVSRLYSTAYEICGQVRLILFRLVRMQY